MKIQMTKECALRSNCLPILLCNKCVIRQIVSMLFSASYEQAFCHCFILPLVGEFTKQTTIGTGTFKSAFSYYCLGDTYLITWMTNSPMRLKEPHEKKNQVSLLFFYSHPGASPVSGPLHRLATVQQALWSAWYMHNATAADWPS